MVIKKSIFYDSTSGSGSIYLRGFKNVDIEQSMFEKCRSLSKEAYGGGGAIGIQPGLKKGIFFIKNCLFLNNSARKFGGAMLVRKGLKTDIRIKYRTQIHVKDSLFIKNEATRSGQSILIEGNTKEIRNVTILSQTKNDADILHAVGAKISVIHLKIEMSTAGVVRNTMRKAVITLKSGMSMSHFDQVEYRCPKSFKSINDH